MADKIIERIEFLTQVHQSWNNTEQRVSLRLHPRRHISYEYIGVNTKQSQYLRALTCGTQTQILQFPLWHAIRQLKEKVYSAQSLIRMAGADMWNYRDMEGVMLWMNDEVGGEHFTLQGITADGVLRLARQASHDWEIYKTMVVPVFWGILQQEDEYSNLTSDLANMIINVEFINRGLNVALPEAVDAYNYPRLVFSCSKNAPMEYMGRELWMMPPVWASDMAVSYGRNARRLDNETGIVRYDLKSDETTETRGIGVHAITLEQIHFMQRFFYRCKGRQKSFYAPTWTRDIELAEDAVGGNTLYTTFNLDWKFYAANKRRRLLIVFFIDGTIEILKVAGYSRDKDYGKVFLDIPLRRALRRREIRMISFLCLYRFNSDTLTTDYETNTVSVNSLEFVEVTE